MEAEILKFICGNNGAVDEEELMCNLFPGESTSDVIINPSKFVLCSSNGQQRVVARTALKLCRRKECPGTCGGLHLCRNYLFRGSCQFLLSRRGCSFPHDLNSDYNQRLLIEHELEGLSRAELCTLLLQSDNSMLPCICHDYNNGDGEFGRCARGVECERLHICEKFQTRSCTCPRAHDFSAYQPKQNLRKKMVPDNIIASLESVYANREALGLHSRGGGGRGHRGTHGPNSGNRASHRGRVRGGYRGPRGGRGNRGNPRPPQLAPSDWLTQFGFSPFSCDSSASGHDFDTRSESGMITQPRQWIRGRGGNRGFRGNRGNRGKPKPPSRTTSFTDLLVEFDDVSLSGNGGPSQSSKGDLNSSNSDVSSSVDNTEASGRGRRRSESRNRTSAGKELGGRRASASASAGGEEGSEGGEQKSRHGTKPAKDKTEICMYFIKGYCKHDDKCFKAHDKMPYRWQVKEGDKWNALPDNETIEKEYCDPSNTYSSGNPPVHFDTMTRGENKVRRLSTVNTVIEPNFLHTTEWLWYWQDEYGKWNRYGSDVSGRKSADINSAALEQKYLDNENDVNDVVEFSTGSQSYSLSFHDMIQTNNHYGTKRLVSRRPLFVSAAEVRIKKVKRPLAEASPVPDNWDRTQIPPTGFLRVVLPRTSDEFKRLEALFCTTLRGLDIIKIERIQNKALWEVFQWQKNQMKNNNNGRDVAEKQLFHGTNSKHVDTICHQNFDWRICGFNGTAYGKGSYFARDAKYSHSYTGDSDVKAMFVSRVLVGSYTKGDSSLVRPPSKDGGDINFYDSCVNDVKDPSIFVVFEKHQIYPEYLLQYKDTHPLVDRLQPPVPPKVPAFTPRASWYQPNSLSYLPNNASSKPSSSSYHISSAASQTTSSPYQFSSSSYQSSTTSPVYGTTPVSQPTVSSPSYSSNPKPKNDSCVVA